MWAPWEPWAAAAATDRSSGVHESHSVVCGLAAPDGAGPGDGPRDLAREQREDPCGELGARPARRGPDGGGRDGGREGKAERGTLVPPPPSGTLKVEIY